MQIKFTNFFLIFNLFLIIAIIPGCVEEPMIDQVKDPYSMIRVTNFSNNVNSMNIKIDNANIINELSSVGYEGITKYFDIKSGKRRFFITDNVSGDTIFNKDIELGAYERMTLSFTGYFSKDILVNSFGVVIFNEGEILVDSSPIEGAVHMYLIHVGASYFADTFALDPEKFRIITKYKHPDSTKYTNINEIPGLEYGKINTLRNSLVLPGNYLYAGNYLFDISKTSGPSMVYPADSLFNAVAGKKYFMFIYGRPDSIKILRDEQVPQPIRVK